MAAPTEALACRAALEAFQDPPATWPLTTVNTRKRACRRAAVARYVAAYVGTILGLSPWAELGAMPLERRFPVDAEQTTLRTSGAFFWTYWARREVMVNQADTGEA